jgi:glycogen debranching enzyme
VDVQSAPSSNATTAEDGKPAPSIRILRTDKNSNSTIQFTSTFNYTGTTPPSEFVPLEGLGASQIFLNSSDSSNSTTSRTSQMSAVLDAIRGNTEVTDQAAFLSYASKSLAGGWRFLTYFGRDTLIALRLLLPVMQPEAAEAILAAVIERTDSETGQLCHEETIGDYASFMSESPCSLASRSHQTSRTASPRRVTRRCTCTPWLTPTSCSSPS